MYVRLVGNQMLMRFGQREQFTAASVALARVIRIQAGHTLSPASDTGRTERTHQQTSSTPAGFGAMPGRVLVSGGRRTCSEPSEYVWRINDRHFRFGSTEPSVKIHLQTAHLVNPSWRVNKTPRSFRVEPCKGPEPIRQHHFMFQFHQNILACNTSPADTFSRTGFPTYSSNIHGSNPSPGRNMTTSDTVSRRFFGRYRAACIDRRAPIRPFNSAGDGSSSGFPS